MLKKILAIACTLIMLFSMSAFALEADTVLTPTVINGDFSENASPWYGSNGGSIAHVAEGTYAGALAVNSDGTKAGYAVQAIAFDFEPGMKYTVEAMVCNPTVNGVRATGFLNAYSYTTWKDLGTRASIAATGTEDWRKVTVSFTVPTASDGSGASGLGKLGIWLANSTLSNAVPIYWDDVKLYETPLLENGNMETTVDYGDGQGVHALGWGRTASGSPKLNTLFQIGENLGAHTGSVFAQIGGIAGNPQLFKNVTLEPNTSYELSFWFKYKTSGASGYPRVSVGSNAGDTTYFDGMNGKTFQNTIPSLSTDTWTKCTYYFVTPAEVAAKCYITLYGLSNTICCYDDVELKYAKTRIMLHEAEGLAGSDIITLPENAPLYAKARFIPKTAEASAMLVAVVFDESKGTKQLEYIDVKPYSTTTGAATTLELTISGYESFAGKAVEVYLWDSAEGLKALTKKLRRSQNAAA